MKPGDNPEEKSTLFVSSHFMMVMSYTILTIALVAESFVMDWDKWVIVPMVFGLLGVWYMHLFRLGAGKMRLWLCVCFMMGEFFYYGTHETSTFDLAPVMCLVMCLCALTGMHSLVTMCQVTYYLTMIYALAGLIKNGSFFDPLTVSRSMLHFVIVTMTGWIARKIIDRWRELFDQSREEIDLLNDSAKRLSDLIANVSHEIRTPINAILGLCSMSISEEKDAKKLENLHSIRDAGRRIGRQINDILDYSEIDRKDLVNNREDYMLSSVLNDLVNELDPVRKREIELVIDVEATIPSVMNTDVGKLKKILYHLIANGLKYTNEGGVYVHLSSARQDYGINLLIEVRDTGIGMDKEQLERICDSFYKADSGRNRSTGGLGLGMMIVHGFVRSLGGFMIVDSTPGEGTIVRVSIPNRVIDDSECMSVTEREGISLGAYLHFEKYPNPHVREYYNSMLKNIVTGLKLPLHRVDNADSLKALIDSKKFTHLFTAAEEYNSAPELMQELAKNVIVTVIANPGEIDLPAGSRVRILPKPFYCFPIVGILNSRSDREMDEEGAVTFPGARVLVVDDEPMNLIVTRGLLSRYGMNVTTCGSGPEAVKLARDNEYDVILMDHMMPVMDGVEAMKLIRTEQAKGKVHVPIIAFTANSVSSAREMFRKAGFDDFVGKPVERVELEHVLKRVLPASLVSYENARKEPEIIHEQPVIIIHDRPAVPSGASRPAVDIKQAQKPETPEPEVDIRPLELWEPVVEKKQPDPDEPGLGEEVKAVLKRLEDLGVDTEKGKGYCKGDTEFYMMILNQYVSESSEKKRVLQEALENNDMNSYSIQAHAIKSTSKMIGAMKLSETARLLEEASNNNDRAYVDANHPVMLAGYEKVIEAIGHDAAASTDPAGVTVEEEDGYDVLEFAPADSNGEGGE